jgi:hypothetical protein
MELKKERGDHEEDDVGIERTTHDNAEAKTHVEEIKSERVDDERGHKPA